VPAVPEIVEFLVAYPPFNALASAEVERTAASAEIEFHLAGTVIFSQGCHAPRTKRTGNRRVTRARDEPAGQGQAVPTQTNGDMRRSDEQDERRPC